MPSGVHISALRNCGGKRCGITPMTVVRFAIELHGRPHCRQPPPNRRCHAP